MVGRSFLERSHFAIPRLVGAYIERNLHEQRRLPWLFGEEVNLAVGADLDLRRFVPATFEFE